MSRRGGGEVGMEICISLAPGSSSSCDQLWKTVVIGIKCCLRSFSLLPKNPRFLMAKSEFPAVDFCQTKPSRGQTSLCLGPCVLSGV